MSIFDPNPMPDYLRKPEEEDTASYAPKIADFGSPEWVANAWRELFYKYPSPGLAKRVRETERWAAEGVQGMQPDLTVQGADKPTYTRPSSLPNPEPPREYHPRDAKGGGFLQEPKTEQVIKEGKAGGGPYARQPVPPASTMPQSEITPEVLAGMAEQYGTAQFNPDGTYLTAKGAQACAPGWP